MLTHLVARECLADNGAHQGEAEAERGVIAGLPEEALVSNQLDSLLSGIEEGEVPQGACPTQPFAQKLEERTDDGRAFLKN